MNYEVPFSTSLWEKILSLIKEVKTTTSPPHIAAFDADGTIWNYDVGEAFLKYQIEHSLVDLPTDPWDFYVKEARKKDHSHILLWLAQINQGRCLKDVRSWAKACYLQNPNFPLFESQKRLIEIFHQNNIEVYIVTASIKWSAEPAALRVGVKPQHVLGVETTIDSQGFLTQEPNGPISQGKGKVEKLLLATKGKKPFFCSGNTSGDLPLLEIATHGKLAVSGAARPDDTIWEAEQELKEIAKKNKWFTHDFFHKTLD